MTSGNSQPFPEMDDLLAALDGQTPAVREMFQYAFALMLIDDEKAVEVRRGQVDGREWLRVRTVNGEEFDVVRPEMSEALEARLLKQVRAIVAEDLGEPPNKPVRDW